MRVQASRCTCMWPVAGIPVVVAEQQPHHHPGSRYHSCPTRRSHRSAARPPTTCQLCPHISRAPTRRPGANMADRASCTRSSADYPRSHCASGIAKVTACRGMWQPGLRHFVPPSTRAALSDLVDRSSLRIPRHDLRRYFLRKWSYMASFESRMISLAVEDVGTRVTSLYISVDI
jgi:hypothetical protein